jgi:putative ubiquitin-RnfH superfamily antitoxin RatB of RatAB toxin-antitoxin module
MAKLRVEVVYALPQRHECIRVELAPGARVRDALAAAGMTGRAQQPLGIFGKLVELDSAVLDGDRVEIYRPLRMDAKEARRRRARKP